MPAIGLRTELYELKAPVEYDKAGETLKVEMLEIREPTRAQTKAARKVKGSDDISVYMEALLEKCVVAVGPEHDEWTFSVERQDSLSQADWIEIQDVMVGFMPARKPEESQTT